VKKVIINSAIVINDEITILHYSHSGVEKSYTSYDKAVARLVKYTGLVNLNIPAKINQYGQVRIDFSQDFDGKREYMVSEVMDE
jgi:hypothetical protein